MAHKSNCLVNYINDKKIKTKNIKYNYTASQIAEPLILIFSLQIIFFIAINKNSELYYPLKIIPNNNPIVFVKIFIQFESYLILFYHNYNFIIV